MLDFEQTSKALQVSLDSALQQNGSDPQQFLLAVQKHVLSTFNSQLATESANALLETVVEAPAELPEILEFSLRKVLEEDITKSHCSAFGMLLDAALWCVSVKLLEAPTPFQVLTPSALAEC